ncbi:hypothetical protein DL768_000654 [Monosporascus sp. mg162]|nr:hypothetical protein DL768_000654 [Monosporascus sp. mg162]
MSGYVVTVKTILIIASTLIILALVRLDAFQPDPTGHGAPPRAEALREQLQHCQLGAYPTILNLDPLDPVHHGPHILATPQPPSCGLVAKKHQYHHRDSSGRASSARSRRASRSTSAASRTRSARRTRAVDHMVCVRWLNPAITGWRRMEAAALARVRRDYCAQALYVAPVNTLVLIWVSDLFRRAVDPPAVGAARWRWGRALAASAE